MGVRCRRRWLLWTFVGVRLNVVALMQLVSATRERETLAQMKSFQVHRAQAHIDDRSWSLLASNNIQTTRHSVHACIQQCLHLYRHADDRHSRLLGLLHFKGSFLLFFFRREGCERDSVETDDGLHKFSRVVSADILADR